MSLVSVLWTVKTHLHQNPVTVSRKDRGVLNYIYRKIENKQVRIFSYYIDDKLREAAFDIVNISL